MRAGESKAIDTGVFVDISWIRASSQRTKRRAQTDFSIRLESKKTDQKMIF